MTPYIRLFTFIPTQVRSQRMNFSSDIRNRASPQPYPPPQTMMFDNTNMPQQANDFSGTPDQSWAMNIRGYAQGTNHMPASPRSTLPPRDPNIQRDIDRGLSIDFYTTGDPMLLASWASFFRDQYILAKNELTKAGYDRDAETYRRATYFLERVETRVLQTEAMKKVFRQYPLSNDPVSSSCLAITTIRTD
jgi:hypothetical protein